MKLLCAAVLGLTVAAVHAQPRGGGGGGMMGAGRGPQFSAAMSKIFGDNSAFSATMEIEINMQDSPMTMPGKIAYNDTKSRFEMDLSQMKSSMVPPAAAAQMKQMGMDKMVVISRPDKKLNYMIYPGLESYAEMQISDPDASKTPADFKMEATELGKETIEGHPTVKNKAVITDDKGEKHEFTVWNATDMKKFPVKIETNENGTKMTMLFKDVKLAKPDAGLFEPPAQFKRYDNMQTMMQEVIMKRMGPGGPGGPGGPRGGGMGGPPAGNN